MVAACFNYANYAATMLHI